MDHVPELTVSMPAYNQEAYIGQALESVLRQEGVDFEIVVVDDGSRDRTADPMRLLPLYARPPEAVRIWEGRQGR